MKKNRKIWLLFLFFPLGFFVFSHNVDAAINVTRSEWPGCSYKIYYLNNNQVFKPGDTIDFGYEVTCNEVEVSATSNCYPKYPKSNCQCLVDTGGPAQGIYPEYSSVNEDVSFSSAGQVEKECQYKDSISIKYDSWYDNCKSLVWPYYKNYNSSLLDRWETDDRDRCNWTGERECDATIRGCFASINLYGSTNYSLDSYIPGTLTDLGGNRKKCTISHARITIPTDIKPGSYTASLYTNYSGLTTIKIEFYVISNFGLQVTNRTYCSNYLYHGLMKKVDKYYDMDQHAMNFSSFGVPIRIEPAFTYSWYSSAWSACSATCGTGTQTRTVYCRRNDGATVADSYCSSPKPIVSQNCNTQECICGAAQTSSPYAFNVINPDTPYCSLGTPSVTSTFPSQLTPSLQTINWKCDGGGVNVKDCSASRVACDTDCSCAKDYCQGQIGVCLNQCGQLCDGQKKVTSIPCGGAATNSPYECNETSFGGEKYCSDGSNPTASNPDPLTFPDVGDTVTWSCGFNNLNPGVCTVKSDCSATRNQCGNTNWIEN